MLVEPPNSAARIQPILVEVVRNGERDRPPKIWYRMEMITNHPRTASRTRAPSSRAHQPVSERNCNVTARDLDCEAADGHSLQ